MEPLAAKLSGYFHFHGLRGALLSELGRVDAARGAMDTKAQIKARVAEAKTGGKPLTPGEKQLAEKFGIALENEPVLVGCAL